MSEPISDLLMSIASVQQRTAVMEQAACRVEQAKRSGCAATEQDLTVIAVWLADAARIAALSCDVPNRLSKELGARLEECTMSLKEQLCSSGTSQVR